MDDLTWPQLSNLMNKMRALPTVDMSVMAMARGPQPTSTDLQNSGVPTKKGKVKRRGDQDGR